MILKNARTLAIVAGGLAALGAGHSAAAQGVGWLTTIEGNQFYPESWPAGKTGFTNTATGQYQVTFYGLGNGVNSDVQVTAVNVAGQPHYCTAAGWYSFNGTDVTVNVDCFDASGNPLNADFNVFYQTRTGTPASGTVAFLWADQPTAPNYTPDAAYSYNSTGGTNTVTRENTGLYFAYLPGIKTTGGNPQATAYSTTAAHCEVVDWYHNLGGTNVVVYCFDASGNPADEYFDLSFTQNATAAVGANTTLGGYAWVNQPTASGTYIPSKKYNFNNVSTRLLNASNYTAGVSFLNMHVPQNVLFSSTLGMVTAYGSAGEFCDYEGLGYYGGAKNETLTLTVACFDAHGNPLATDYTATMMTGQ